MRGPHCGTVGSRCGSTRTPQNTGPVEHLALFPNQIRTRERDWEGGGLSASVPRGSRGELRNWVGPFGHCFGGSVCNKWDCRLASPLECAAGCACRGFGVSDGGAGRGRDGFWNLDGCW